MGFTHILKRLARTPLFTAFTVLTLAIGIGANTAIFSVIEGILLRPLPFHNSDELVVVNHSAPGVNLENAGAAPFQYFTYREDATTFQDIGLWNTDTSSLTGLAEPEEIRTLNVTPNVLSILKVQPLVGRLFSEADGAPDGPPTVVLTYGFWRSKFGGDRSLVGRTILLDGRSREVIGVLPEEFRFLDTRPAALLPIQFDRKKTYLGQFNFQAVARVKPGVTLAQANADVARMIPISINRFPPFPGYSAKMFVEARLSPLVQPLKQSVVGDLDQSVLGAHGHGGDRSSDRLRERREPVAGARRGTAARTCDSRGARRRLGPNRTRAAAREPDARRHRRNRARSGSPMVR